MDQSVQDGVCKGGIRDQFVPLAYGNLTGDERGRGAASIVQNFRTPDLHDELLRNSDDGVELKWSRPRNCGWLMMSSQVV